MPTEFENFAKNEWRDIAVILYGANYKLGITEKLTNPDIVSLIKFIYDNYKDFNATEIEHSIDLYCTRELPDLDYSTEKHYNKFSHVFLGMLLTSYRSYRSKRQMIERNAKKKPLIEHDKRHDRLIWYTKNIFLPYDELRSSGKVKFNDLDLELFYKQLNPKGLFKDYVEDGSYKDFLEQAKSITEQRKRSFENRIPESDADYELRCKKVARRLLALDWLQTKAMEDVDIRELIMNKLKDNDK